MQGEEVCCKFCTASCSAAHQNERQSQSGKTSAKYNGNQRGPGELTDDQVMELLKISFRQPEVVLALAKMVHNVHERSNVQNPLE